MTPASRALLRADVMGDEGTGPIRNGRLLPYLDCCGKFWRDCQCQDKGVLTVGWGRNLERGITRLEAEVLLDHDLSDVEAECLRSFPWFGGLNEVRQRVVANMLFNMGLPTLSQFTNTLTAIASKQYDKASRGMLASRWASQVKGRAVRLARMMRDGA
jgi:lysozyme